MTAQSADTAIDPALLGRAMQGIRFGLDALNGMEPLVPFAIMWLGSGERVIDHSVHATYEDSIEHTLRLVNAAARRGADDPGLALAGYAVAWEGYVSAAGERMEAIIIEAALADSPYAVHLAQPYTFGEKAEPNGEPMLLGSASNLLNTQESGPLLEGHLISPAFLTTDATATHPFAQMAIAAICVTANMLEDEEAERITLGIRELQRLEQESASQMGRHTFGVLVAQVASGDLMAVLPCDTRAELMQLIVKGAAELQDAVQHGKLLATDAAGYLAEVRGIIEAVLHGAEIPDSGAKLLAVFDRLAMNTATAA